MVLHEVALLSYLSDHGYAQNKALKLPKNIY